MLTAAHVRTLLVACHNTGISPKLCFGTLYSITAQQLHMRCLHRQCSRSAMRRTNYVDSGDADADTRREDFCYVRTAARLLHTSCRLRPLLDTGWPHTAQGGSPTYAAAPARDNRLCWPPSRPAPIPYLLRPSSAGSPASVPPTSALVL